MAERESRDLANNIIQLRQHGNKGTCLHYGRTVHQTVQYDMKETHHICRRIDGIKDTIQPGYVFISLKQCLPESTTFSLSAPSVHVETI